MPLIRLFVAALTVIAVQIGTANAQYPQLAKSWNVRNLAWAWSALDLLNFCYMGSARAITRPELDDFAEVMGLIIRDARARDPSIDIDLVHIDAMKYAHMFNRTYDPAEWMCDNARIALSQALFARRNPKDYARIDDLTKRMQCTGGACMSLLYHDLDVQGLLPVEGRYCKADEEACLKARADRLEEDAPLQNCSMAAANSHPDGPEAAIRECEEKLKRQRQ